MGKNEEKTHPQPYNSLEQLIKDGCSLNQMQLEEELEWAEQKIKDAKEMPFLTDIQPPVDQPSEALLLSDGFRDMLAKLEERKITPRVITDFDLESQKVFRCGNFWQIRWILERITENSYHYDKLSKNSCRENEQEKDTKSNQKRNHVRKSNTRKKKALSLVNIIKIVAVCFAFAAVFRLMFGMDLMGQHKQTTRNYHYKKSHKAD